MRLHVIQHVPFEGPAAIAEWADRRGHELTSSLAVTEEYPPVSEVDFLVVMGGPMAADDHGTSPWLPAEKHFIAQAVAAGRLVLGVCLGAQILAEVLGGKVRRSPEREIGWYAVTRTSGSGGDPVFSAWGESEVVGQWHSDTFDLPEGIMPSWSSDACPNQAFVFDGRAVGLQFHLEWTSDALDALIASCADDLGQGGLFEMSAIQIEDEAAGRLPRCREMLFGMLDAMAARGPGLAGDGVL